MIPPIKHFSFVNNGLDRRTFLKGVGATGALILTANWSWAQQDEEKKYGGDAMPGGTKEDPKLFIAIHEDGTVDITCARSEMGQGIKTSLALVVADESFRAWNPVRRDRPYFFFKIDDKSPLLAGDTTTHREHVWSAVKDWRLVYDGRHKLVTGYGDAPLLFDLAEDPLENHNLAPEAPNEVKRLREALETLGF